MHVKKDKISFNDENKAEKKISICNLILFFKCHIFHTGTKNNKKSVVVDFQIIFLCVMFFNFFIFKPQIRAIIGTKYGNYLKI